MNIPPFPSQDLAKLVLGYLAEEQLMTAYDEFLQASPYLDAYGNEYDRIFMTSLKNILAEYRAVKIYVETCKPFHLRRKLFQCSNLLEMFKFLILHVDITKIQPHELNQSIEKLNPICEICKSAKLENCMCYNKSTKISSDSSTDDCQVVALDSAVEATALSDLPGNHNTRKKAGSDGNATDLKTISNSSSKLIPSDVASEKPLSSNSFTNMTLSRTSVDKGTQLYNPLITHTDSLQVKEKEEFNNILNQVCHVNQSSAKNTEVANHNSMEGYKHFATGVSGHASEVVPDSSTEQLYLRVPVNLEGSIISNTGKINKMKQTRTQYLLKVAHVNNTFKPNEVVTITTKNNCALPHLKPKPDESKIKILSDVKVDNNDGILKMPPVLKNATSTPLLQMQTIVINGTQVYRQKAVDNKINYTKDEIMAMPTIILAPAPGPPPNICSMASQSSNLSSNTNITSTARSMCPLTIDVDAESPEKVNKDSNKAAEVVSGEIEKLTLNSNAPKILDITSASAPKDTLTAGTAETSTPQMLPPTRKSSSTPRRTSHVRVLDFTTPRRILHENANKLVTTVSDTETALSTNQDNDNQMPTNTHTDLKNENTGVDTKPGNDNTTIKKVYGKKGNWDAELRALAVISESSAEVSHSLNSTAKTQTVKKKKPSKNSLVKKENNKQGTEKQTSKKRTTKKSTNKKNIETEPAEGISKNLDNIPVKPTINIISGPDRHSTGSENDKSHNKSNNDKMDTPDLERMSLQNEIGAKLNISDLLETPYKQALYDIQMETPRFMGPDIPDDPMSDIKIMNIPTPKFLNALTPSSYCSRPTDYSSGGSYYKPDDQDYMRVADDFVCPSTSSGSKENKKLDVSNSTEVDTSDNNDKNGDKPLRPVRKCTKNVSYYKHANLNVKQTKETDNKTDSLCGDVSDHSYCETSIDKESKCNKENKSKTINKSSLTNKLVTKKRKSPIKKEISKSFMKIRPRRPTPIKKDDGKRKKKTPESGKAQGRKKIAKKQEDATPVVVSAPTKSRRKSSTPRKLHCTKSFNSESPVHVSPEFLTKTKKDLIDSNTVLPHDSDTEQLPLRWSDDGSQDVKAKETESISITESEDINKIQEYLKHVAYHDDSKEGSLHIDLVKRGFDLETAKIIERDLLDSSPHVTSQVAVESNVVVISESKAESVECVSETKNANATLEKTLESDCSTSNNLQIVQEDEEEEVDEVELSVHECNEDTANFFLHNHDDIENTLQKELPKLKDKFSMEVCLDDDVSIRLRATPFTTLLDQEPDENFLNYNEQETEMAVRSISNMSKLYTPLKESIKAQCYDIFDSTLTSLDTPLKARSPKVREVREEVTVTEIVLEVENIGAKEKCDTKKRKRSDLSPEDNEPKKSKQGAQYLLNSTNIQNIDIESVLSKLHGP